MFSCLKGIAMVSSYVPEGLAPQLHIRRLIAGLGVGSVGVPVSMQEVDLALSAIKELARGIKEAKDLGKNERQKMRDALRETCEMIDTILTTVRGQISQILRELRLKDEEAARHIAYLGVAEFWEDAYRNLHLCVELRDTTSELKHSVINRLVGKYNFSDKEGLERQIEGVLRAEGAAANTISAMLDDLAKLCEKVDTDREMVIDEFEKARDTIQGYRDVFIELEKEMRESI